MLAYTDGDLRAALTAGLPSTGGEAEVVHQVHPDAVAVTPIHGLELSDCAYPPDAQTYVGVSAGTTVVADQRLMIDRPSTLPTHLLEAACGRRVVLHVMHSVSDRLGFAEWDGNGELVRSLSVAPEGGVIEDIGEKFAFELPFWAGAHPVLPEPGWDGAQNYPLPFHPLEMGEEALRHLFGFIVEGRSKPDDVDAGLVTLQGFRVELPSAAAHRAATAAAVAAMAPPTRFRMDADGSLVEIGDPST